MKEESQEAEGLVAKLHEFARMQVDGVSVDRRLIDAIAMARLLADAEDDIAEGRTRSLRLFFREFHKQL